MYCSKCGAQIMDEAVICPKCGCLVNNNAVDKLKFANNGCSSGLSFAAKVLMIISCVCYGFMIIPLLWMVPMTISYCNKVKKGEPIGTSFKICSLLFVNMIAGILMLCDTNHA